MIGGMSVLTTYLVGETHMDLSAITIKTFNGIFNKEKCKVFIIEDKTIITYNTLIVSSITGMLVQYDGLPDIFVSGAEKISDAVFLVRSGDKIKLIDFSGNNLHSGWAANQVNFNPHGENQIATIHFPYGDNGKSVGVIDIKNGKFLCYASQATFTIDLNHIKIKNKNNRWSIIDFQGNRKIEWAAHIDDLSLKSQGSIVYCYIVTDRDDTLYDENFNEVINFTKENILFKVSNAAKSPHIVLFKNGLNNILDKNLKPMFDPWLDRIIYDYFGQNGYGYLFICHSEKGYVIMDGTEIKPIEGIPEYIEDIKPLGELTTGKAIRYGLKIDDNVCKILSYTAESHNAYKFEFKDIRIKNILTNSDNIFIDTDKGIFGVLSETTPKLSRKQVRLLELVRCDKIFETYFVDEYVVERDGKFNIIKRNSEGIGKYFQDDIDNVYDIQNRFIIVERGKKFAYFDTTKFDLLSRNGVTWWDDIEPAEELHPSGRWVFRVKDNHGNWIEA